MQFIGFIFFAITLQAVGHVPSKYDPGLFGPSEASLDYWDHDKSFDGTINDLSERPYLSNLRCHYQQHNNSHHHSYPKVIAAKIPEADQKLLSKLDKNFEFVNLVSSHTHNHDAIPLGKGADGVVYLTQNKIDKSLWAAKFYDSGKYMLGDLEKNLSLIWCATVGNPLKVILKDGYILKSFISGFTAAYAIQHGILFSETTTGNLMRVKLVSMLREMLGHRIIFGDLSLNNFIWDNVLEEWVIVDGDDPMTFKSPKLATEYFKHRFKQRHWLPKWYWGNDWKTQGLVNPDTKNQIDALIDSI